MRMRMPMRMQMQMLMQMPTRMLTVTPMVIAIFRTRRLSFTYSLAATG
jgi:hypothetical protein